MPILTGILLGLSTLLFIGPVLFYLLKSSMESGFKAGIAVALGIIIGDIICVFAALYGAKSILNNPDFKYWLALSGGVILLAIGLKYVLKPSIDTIVKGKLKKKSYGIYFLNGFLVNFVNPFVFAVWLGFVTYNESMYDRSSTIVSLILTLVVIFATDLIKALFANRITNLIQPEKLRIIFRVFGIGMIIFGLRLMWVLFE